MGRGDARRGERVSQRQMYDGNKISEGLQMNCAKCNQPLASDARFCPNCGAKVLQTANGIRIGGVAVDASGGTSVINIGAASAATSGGHCPICGAYNKPEQTFRCANCERELICRKHQDSVTFWCSDCAGAPSRMPSPGLFQFNYQFVYPYLPMNREALVQVVVNFTSRKDVDWSTLPSIPTHLCLVLDVSGSMNTPDKYPLLRQAIPYLIHALSDDDYLTIILFSIGHDVALPTERVSQCKTRINTILNRIDRSGIIFGGGTLLERGLRAAMDEVEHFRQHTPIANHRIYVLTDGELHDAEQCYQLNPRLRSLEVELHSYGFGKDFALDTMKRIMEGLPGGTVKAILNTQEVKNTFSHIGELAERIIAQDAEFTFTFAQDVIPGDAFRYHPGIHYFGMVDQRSKTFSVKLGTLERDRVYTFLLEGRLNARGQPQQEIGKAMLQYRQGGKREKIQTDVVVNRTNDAWRTQRPDEQALEIFHVLDATRRDDPQTQLKALYARRAIYRREGADPALVSLVEHAIEKLERGEQLTEEQARGLQADKATRRVFDQSNDEVGFE